MREFDASYIVGPAPAALARCASLVPEHPPAMLRSSLRPERFVLVTLPLALVGLAGAATAQSMSGPAAGMGRYRFDSKTQQVVDAAAIGQGRQQAQTDRSAFLRITVADSAGGKVITAVIDSIVNHGDNLPPGTDATADSARGKVFTGRIAADGTVSPMTHPAGAGALGTAVGGQLDEFFPRVKVSAATGDNWTISSERPQVIANGQLTVKRTTAYQAMGAVTREGVSAQRFDMTFTTSIVGTQQVGPSNAKVDGTSTGTGSAFVTTGGVYVGGMRTEKAERRLLLTGAPAPVLVTVETATTITLLK